MRNMCGVALLVTLFLAVPGYAEDRHAGYYYPVPATEETYRARARTLTEASRHTRVSFVTNISNGMLSNNPYPPQFAMFVKGARKEKLIIVGLRDDSYNTIYRVRALLAQLTAVSRTTRVFQEQMKPDHLTFLDLLNMMGFEQLTVSDGKDFAHQILIR